MFSEVRPNYPEMFTSRLNVPKLEDIIFTKEEITDVLKNIKQSSASGFDNFPAYLLKHCASSLATPLLIMWRRSLDSGTMPEGIIKSIITPIFKNSGSKCDPANYRPVALTSQLTKVFERILHKAILSHLIDNALINEGQHGFRPGRGTLSQLLFFYNTILEELEEGGKVDAIYLDFAKAFDKVDHHILLEKLKHHNIDGKIYNWISAFLTKRVQAVRVCGQLSPFIDVKSGVPQGSVLGPLLFIIMMFDIDKNIVAAYLSSFADDTRIWKNIKTPEDSRILQDNIHKTVTWANRNNMQFNCKKFDHVGFGRNLQKSDYFAGNNVKIEKKSILRDLGVSISDDLLFKTHISSIVSKAYKMVGWILRTFKSRQTVVMMTLFKSLVVPLVEYCCPLWSPQDSQLISMIESVQLRFTRKLAVFLEHNDEVGHAVCYSNYEHRLKELKLFSLQRRRDRYMIIYIFKIIHGFVPNPGIELTLNNRHMSITAQPVIPRSHAPAWVKKIRHESLFGQGCRLFNRLPHFLRKAYTETSDQASLLASYKTKLNTFLESIPDTPSAPNNSLLHHLEYQATMDL